MDLLIEVAIKSNECYCDIINGKWATSDLNPYWCDDCKKRFDNPLVLPKIELKLNNKCSVCLKNG